MIGKHNTKGPREKAEQRKRIWELYEQGVLITEIARQLNCSTSSVSSNLRRQKEKRVRVSDYNKPSLRDQFAMAALAGIEYHTSVHPPEIARYAYEIANAMMEARNVKS